jgi:two-component system sensor histidine kinase UhpB
VPLLWRVVAVNALLLVVAVAVTIVVLDPDRASSFHWDVEGIVLTLAVVAVVGVNLILVRRVIRPVQAVTRLARQVDPDHPGQRLPDAAPTSEAGDLALTFNDMLARLETERRDATGRVLAAQESERLRIAQELHDQVGQELTAVLLSLARAQGRAPTPLQADLAEVQDAVRGSLEEVRRIAVELRPEALDDLGLESALAVLSERFADYSGLRVTQTIAEDLPELSPDVELVVYRVAQEALTNVARHSGADAAELTVSRTDGVVTLDVIDHGRGLPQGVEPGTGMRGMRERAGLIGAELKIESDIDAGCRVTLAVPLHAR